MIILLLQGLGGGGVILTAAVLILIADTSPRSWRSFNFALFLVAHTVSLLYSTMKSLTALKSLHVAQACWVIYLAYLALFLRQDPRPTVIHVAQSGNAREDDALSETSETRPVSWTLQSIREAAEEPAKLFFGTQTLAWIGVVVFAMSLAEGLFWHYAMHSAEKHDDIPWYTVSVELV